jgi:hypothetical protein
MEKRLTETELEAAIKDLDVGPQTIEIARGVLVQGTPQIEFVRRLGLSKGAVSQAVARVWDAHTRSSLPEGYEHVEIQAVLPREQAQQIRTWIERVTKR